LWAIASPIPVPAPVMMDTLPSRRFIMLNLLATGPQLAFPPGTPPEEIFMKCATLHRHSQREGGTIAVAKRLVFRRWARFNQREESAGGRIYRMRAGHGFGTYLARNEPHE
jgi:hypothetical protein